jgi:hypothetical protein
MPKSRACKKTEGYLTQDNESGAAPHPYQRELHFSGDLIIQF